MYLYHIKPLKIEGDHLLPFSSLNEELKIRYSTKYTDRKSVPLQYIPNLDAKWQDIIHLSPVDLGLIKQYIFQHFDIDLKFEYYKIPLNALDKIKAVIYLNNQTIHNTNESQILNNYVPFSDLKKYQEIPTITKEYYKLCYQNKIRPLLFYGVPHVFYKGKIAIKELELLK